MLESQGDGSAVEHRLAGSEPVISPRIRVADVDGLILVMDLQTSAFFVLDDDASRMWQQLQEAAGSVAAAKEALERGDDSARHLAGIFDGFIADCQMRGFLHFGQPVRAQTVFRAPRPRQAPRGPLLTVRAWLSMLRMDIALRRYGFEAVYERLGQPGSGGARNVDSGKIAAARAAFLRAENFYVRRRAPNDCLPRSLALYVYMRDLGFPVLHCIGARRFPTFRSHAWVEYKREPILDQRAKIADYTVIASV
jgi:Transglutaminase-like superfamily